MMKSKKSCFQVYLKLILKLTLDITIVFEGDTRSEFPKLGQVALLGAMRSKGAEGMATSSKGVNRS